MKAILLASVFALVAIPAIAQQVQPPSPLEQRLIGHWNAMQSSSVAMQSAAQDLSQDVSALIVHVKALETELAALKANADKEKVEKEKAKFNEDSKKAGDAAAAPKK